jgi:hypothetical protein
VSRHFFCLDTFGRQADEYITRGVMFFMFFYVFYVSMFAYMNRVSATPARPPKVPFLGRERYVFMFLGETNCACGHELIPPIDTAQFQLFIKALLAVVRGVSVLAIYC